MPLQSREKVNDPFKLYLNHIKKETFLIIYNSLSMKRDHCIEVKYANHLSSAYLTRFFGSVGAVTKVEKDENSKYVTIVKNIITSGILTQK